jgi:hypothetical protein
MFYALIRQVPQTLTQKLLPQSALDNRSTRSSKSVNAHLKHKHYMRIQTQKRNILIGLSVLLQLPIAYATDGDVLHGVGSINQSMGGAGIATSIDVISSNYNSVSGPIISNGAPGYPPINQPIPGTQVTNTLSENSGSLQLAYRF